MDGRTGAMSPVTGVLLGVGNSLNGDDGVGSWVAQRFRAPGWLAIDCGTAPENFTAVVRRAAPSTLVVVDAAALREPPGTMRRIPPTRIEDTGIGTHMLPLSHVLEFLRPSVGQIELVGIEPACLDVGAGLSSPVLDAGRQLLALLDAGRWHEIPLLSPMG